MRKLLLPFVGAVLLSAAALTMPQGTASSAPACAQASAVKVAERGGLKCAHRRVCRPGQGCAWRKVCKRW
jgi:hypothetical protein